MARTCLQYVLDPRLQMCSKDRNAAGNVTEPEGDHVWGNVDVVGIVVRPLRVEVEATGVDVEGIDAKDVGRPGGAKVEEGEGTGEGAREG